jgi:hypothetical protein
VPQGLKPGCCFGFIGTTEVVPFQSLRFTARLNSLLKKSEQKSNPAKDGSAGAKARFILVTLLARLKPCRCYKAAQLSFSSSCGVVP